MTEPNQVSTNDTITLPVSATVKDFRNAKHKIIADAIRESGFGQRAAIARRFGITPQTVYNVGKAAGLPVQYRLSFDRRKEFAENIRTGEFSPLEFSRIHDICISSVYKICNEFGVRCTRRSAPWRGDPKVTSMAAIGLLQSGLSVIRVAEKLQLTRQRIDQICQNARVNGIKFPHDRMTRAEFESQGQEEVTNEQEPVLTERICNA